MGIIAENIMCLKERMSVAAKRAGRDTAEISLVAVSKKMPADKILEAFQAGHSCFGENYAQELRNKYRQLQALVKDEEKLAQLEWHFIGHLQRNKVKYVAGLAGWVETIDSMPLAVELNRRVAQPVSVLIEVNLGEEEVKAGVSEDQVFGLIEGLSVLEKIKLKGLMIIPPYNPDPENSRPYFKKLRNLLDKVNQAKIYPVPLKNLSMGMSHDFETAIEEGATIIRVGTAIFGER
jgi:pyridoxal phosphate enzyme (YggS family)